jgi:ABC-type multidrug transport system fused ATPase/permease subunit
MQEVAPIHFLLSWMPRREKFLLGIITFFQVIAGLLDLLSVVIASFLVSAFLSPEKQISLGRSISEGIPFLIFTNSEDVLKFLLFVVFILMTLKGALSLILSRILLARLSKFSKHVSKSKFEQLLNQTLSFSKSTNKVELGYALSDGVSVLLIGLLSALVAFVTEISLIVFLSLGLIFVNKGVGVFVLVYFSLIILVLSKILGQRIDDSASKFIASSIKARTSINDSLFLFREIRTMSKSNFFLSRYNHAAENSATQYADLLWWQQLPKFVFEIALLIALAMLGVFSWFFLDLNEGLLLGVTFAVAGFRIVPSILRLQAANLTLRDFQGRGRDVFPLLTSLEESTPLSQNRSTGLILSDTITPPRIELRNLSFSYSDDIDVIENLNYIFEPGVITYIDGKSGSGKTTLCDIILNFLTPKDGEILFDGYPYLDWIHKAEQRIAFMPQEPHFFIGTIRENLLMGLEENIDLSSEMLRLISKLDLNKHISSLPDGLDTVLTDRNLEFSGGQKQRLALVRTLLMRPNLCIIDEGTSALDLETEKATEVLLDELTRKCTLIRIAHKKDLSMEKNARVLFV